MKIYQTIHEAYLGSLADVLDNPEHVCAPRGLKIKEKLDYSFRVLNPVAEPIVTKDLKRNEVIKSYTAKESELYNSGSNLVEDFEKASSFWRKIVNPDGKTINSAYGYLLFKNKSCGNINFEFHKEMEEDFLNSEEIRTMINTAQRTPWEWAKMSLMADKDTRQAIIRFSLPEHQWRGNRDQVCTLSGNFLIRDNKLNLSILMRSNDLHTGLVYDLEFFVGLIHKMKNELISVYPDLEIGHYTHIVHSLHIYEKDEPAILKMLGRI